MTVECRHHGHGLLEPFHFLTPLVYGEKRAFTFHIQIEAVKKPILVVRIPRPHIVAFRRP